MDINLPNCVFCDTPVDPANPSVHRRVIGWEKSRDQGGTNAVRLRVPLNEFACGACVDLESKGISSKQRSLM